MEDRFLAICIPTFNRPEILFENLLSIVDEIKINNISLYISDDSNNNETEELFYKYFSRESNFHYIRNTPSFGHDLNCYKTISLAKEEYIWYLGDSMQIKNGAIRKVIDFLNLERPDILSFNCENRKGIFPKSQLYNDEVEILQDLAWHLTMTGVTIYKKSSFNFDLSKIIEYKNFPQLALIFMVLYFNKKFKFFWLNENLISGNAKKKSYWAGNQIDVFVDDLKNTLKKLPNKFNCNQIELVIKNHIIKTKILGYKSLILMRFNDKYDFNFFVQKKRVLKKYTDNNLFIMFLISITPKLIINYLFTIKKK